jgi:ParB-like chromosome segregation protein Spo0J
MSDQTKSEQQSASRDIPIVEIDLDPGNPRFGQRIADGSDQTAILDEIVNQYGVTDLLSSLAVNGYFKAEPLVCIQREDGRYTVVEGNRRLSACLILTGEIRAKNHKKKTEVYGELWRAHGAKPISQVPCQVFDLEKDQTEILSFLGVRHISASQPWDSYAKSAWVARISETTNLSVEDIAAMVGDKSNTVSRLLLGYYVTMQVVNAGRFDPSQSKKSGRGSQNEFPFSWVYTIIGYSNTQSYLGLTSSLPVPDPIPEGRLDQAENLFRFMFGDESTHPVIGDSRDIGSLAAALGDERKLVLLEQGISLFEVLNETRSTDVRMLQSLRASSQQLSSCISLLVVSDDIAENMGALQEEATKVERLVQKVIQELRNKKSHD